MIFAGPVACRPTGPRRLRAVGRASSFVVGRVAERLASTTERGIAMVVERRGPAVARAAERLRAEHPGAGPGELSRIATARASRRAAGTGAVSALPAVLPGPGTAIEVGAAIGDASLLTIAQAELALTIAHLHGLPLDDVDARRLDVLMAMGVEAGVVDLRRDGSIRILGTTYARDELGRAADAGLAARVSRRLATQVVARLARRRAHVLLGRELPIVGLGVAAGYNLWSTRTLGRAAERYCRHVT
jgi:hypothetical protein